MTICGDIVGVEAGPMLQEIDTRWPQGAAHVYSERIRCRFGAMVLVPSTLTVEGSRAASPEGEAMTFRVLTEKGEPAIRDGVVILHG